MWVLRIGSRIPIFLPQRITPDLCKMLALPSFVHERSSNHPDELTLEVKQTLSIGQCWDSSWQ